MLYRMIVRLIEVGQTEGLAEKIDVFFAYGKITEQEYLDLLAMLDGR